MMAASPCAADGHRLPPGRGLGISGLADTVAMDSIGAPPVRLNVAAKGSIVDVNEAGSVCPSHGRL